MEAMHLQDLTNASEVVLDLNQRAPAPCEPAHPHPMMKGGAGAVRLGKVVGAAFNNGPASLTAERCERIFIPGGTLVSF